MTLDPKKIEQWAREARLLIDAGGDVPMVAHKQLLEHFASLARADAFEMSAKEADELAQAYGGVRESPIHTEFGRALSEAKAVGAHNAAVRIRALAEREKEPRP